MNVTLGAKSRANWPQGWRATLGMIMPSAWPGYLYEHSIMVPEGVAIISVPLGLKEVTVEALKAISEEVVEMSKRLFFAGMISYNCTSGAFIMGAEHDRQIIAGIEKATGKPATSMAAAVVEGLKVLGTKKMILVSPYIKEITNTEVNYFADHGFETVYHESLGIADHSMVWRTPAENYKFAMQVYRNAPGADVLFITCGGMQTIETIDALEKATGMPVISSNTCQIRECLKLVGIHEPIHGYGSLLEMER